MSAEPLDVLRVLRLCSVFEPPPGPPSPWAVRFDPIGGMQNHTATLTRALDARGVRQRVVTARRPGAPARQSLGEHSLVHRVGLPVPVMRQFHSLPAAILVERLARQASLIHAHLGQDLAIVPIAATAAHRHGVPWILTIHESLAHTYVGDGLRGAIMRHLGGRLERAGTARADAVIVLTPRQARLTAGDGVADERIHVIPPGVVAVDPGAVNRPPKRVDGRPVVLFVGRLSPQKGVRYLIEAAARMTRADFVIRLVGDGPERPELEALVDRLRLAERVRFDGFVAHDDVAAIMAAADVLVLPSVAEEFGSVLVEAMQAGLPVVATRTGGIADAVGDAGVLVPPRDPAALAAAIERLFADGAERQRLSALARRRAGEHDWELLADRILALYRKVVADRRPGGLASESRPGAR